MTEEGDGTVVCHGGLGLGWFLFAPLRNIQSLA